MGPEHAVGDIQEECHFSIFMIDSMAFRCSCITAGNETLSIRPWHWWLFFGGMSCQTGVTIYASGSCSCWILLGNKTGSLNQLLIYQRLLFGKNDIKMSPRYLIKAQRPTRLGF